MLGLISNNNYCPRATIELKKELNPTWMFLCCSIIIVQKYTMFRKFFLSEWKQSCTTKINVPFWHEALGPFNHVKVCNR